LLIQKKACSENYNVVETMLFLAPELANILCCFIGNVRVCSVPSYQCKVFAKKYLKKNICDS
jgi:hypothetical protein